MRIYTAVSAQTQRLRQTLAATSGVAAVSPPQLNPAGDTAVLSVVPTGSPQDAQVIGEVPARQRLCAISAHADHNSFSAQALTPKDYPGSLS
jgi:hypothetical protein